jgi:hypothetical protein
VDERSIDGYRHAFSTCAAQHRIGVHGAQSLTRDAGALACNSSPTSVASASSASRAPTVVRRRYTPLPLCPSLHPHEPAEDPLHGAFGQQPVHPREHADADPQRVSRLQSLGADDLPVDLVGVSFDALELEPL